MNERPEFDDVDAYIAGLEDASGMAEAIAGHWGVSPRLRNKIADEIAASVPLGFDLNANGSEDRERAAYVEGIRDAAQVARGTETTP